MTRPWAVAILVAGLAVACSGAGCATGGNSLSRDQQIQQLMEKNRLLQADLHQSQQRVADLVASGRTPASPPASQDPYRAVSLQIGAGSGVVDRAAGPAKERLRVLIYPVDASGDVVKRAGSLDLVILEPGAKGQPPLAKPFGHWSLPADELAMTWLSGLGEYGYVLRLPWPQDKPPTSEAVIVRARFTTLDGRTLSAEAEIPIKQPAPGTGPGAR